MQLLKDRDVAFTIREYLKKAPSNTEVLKIFKKLGLAPGEFVRKHELEFKENELEKIISNDLEMAKAISRYPKIMERPIVVNQNKAIVCRPPEKLLTLLK